MAGLDKEIEGEGDAMPDLNIGYLPQEPQLDPEQTVRQAVQSGLGEVFVRSEIGRGVRGLCRGGCGLRCIGCRTESGWKLSSR